MVEFVTLNIQPNAKEKVEEMAEEYGVPQAHIGHIAIDMLYSQTREEADAEEPQISRDQSREELREKGTEVNEEQEINFSL